MKKLLFLIPAIVALMGCSSDSNGMKQKFLILLTMAFGLVACALDGEPEKYYFDNGSRVQNFFKDKPTNFNLQLGLRWNLR